MLVTKDSGVVMARKDWRGSGSWEKIIIFFSEKYNLVWMMYDSVVLTMTRVTTIIGHFL